MVTENRWEGHKECNIRCEEEIHYDCLYTVVGEKVSDETVVKVCARRDMKVLKVNKVNEYYVTMVDKGKAVTVGDAYGIYFTWKEYKSK